MTKKVLKESHMHRSL